MNKLTLVGAAVLCIGAAMGYKGMLQLRTKAELQAQATEAVARWKQSYRALETSVSQWNNRYPGLSAYSDTLGLYRSLRLQAYGLAANPDRLAIVSKESVSANGVELGLAKICMASAADKNAGLELQAANYRELLDGVGRLAQRKDVYMGGMKFIGDGDRPTASITDFCILLRMGPAA
ncbi:hypothetical protein [Stenotrophomonas sp. STK17_22]|uniref:hypothetical protein n=1 Tax=Stenotrophomonas sp. STK17_22 TaxID=3455201 RepID=UPI003F7CE57D